MTVIPTILVNRADVATVAEFVAQHGGDDDEAQQAATRLLDVLLKPTYRAPVCADEACGVSVEFLPRSGWGQKGEWRHVDVSPAPGHQARPRVLIDPVPRPRSDP